MASALGADHVIDYTRDDFTRGESRYDVILGQRREPPASGRHFLIGVSIVILGLIGWYAWAWQTTG